MTDAIAAAHIADNLRLFILPGQVAELRALNVGMPGTSPITKGGYYDFDHLEAMARAALELENKASGVYFTLNPVKPELLARQPNQCAQLRSAAQDSDILERRFILIDADPVRSGECAATDAEKQAAWEVIQNVKRFLLEEMESPADALILADPGNGAHLLCRVSLPADCGDTVRAMLHYIDKRFGTDDVQIDLKVGNAARIVRLYGTLNRKGESSADRPHRRSRIVDAPASTETKPGVLSGDAIEFMRSEGAALLAPPIVETPAIRPIESEKLYLRVTKYVDRLDEAISGQGGHDKTFRAASAIFNGFALSAEDGWPFLARYNEERTRPRWSERELRHKMNSALKAGCGPNGKPKGWLRDEDGRREATPIARAMSAGDAVTCEEQPAVAKPAIIATTPSGRAVVASAPTQEAPAEPKEEKEVCLGTVEVRQAPDAPGLDSEAGRVIYQGLAGEFVRRIDPNTEADPFALLIHFLVFFGNIVGRKPYFYSGGRQYPSIYTVLLGDSSTGRKGTAYREIAPVFRQVGGDWHKANAVGGCIMSGPESGQAIVSAVGDAVVRHRNRRGANGEPEVQSEVVQTAARDKRLMILQQEFSHLLKTNKREGSNSSEVLRQAYDSGCMSSQTKDRAYEATDVHVSILGHSTPDEFKLLVDPISLLNGFANRFLYFRVGISKLLPEGGDESEFSDLLGALDDRITAASGIGKMTRSAEATREWSQAYVKFNTSPKTLADKLAARSMVNILRFAIIYALLDGSAQIEKRHQDAAFAIWDHCKATLEWLYGSEPGDIISTRILEELLEVHPGGLNRTAIYDLFHGHCNREKLDTALKHLQGHGLVDHKLSGVKGKAGRKGHWYYATTAALPYRAKVKESDEGRETA